MILDLRFHQRMNVTPQSDLRWLHGARQQDQAPVWSGRNLLHFANSFIARPRYAQAHHHRLNNDKAGRLGVHALLLSKMLPVGTSSVGV